MFSYPLSKKYPDSEISENFNSNEKDFNFNLSIVRSYYSHFLLRECTLVVLSVVECTFIVHSLESNGEDS